MAAVTRRDFLRTSGVAGLMGGLWLGGCAPAAVTGEIQPTTRRRVVVVGGGWGGATAAKYLRLADPTVEVILLEPNRQFVSCPFSNLVLSGVRTMESITFGYEGLRQYGVKVLHNTASAVDGDGKRVRLDQGYLAYDRVVVSPGVDFQLDQVEGLARNQDKVLHAWKAGPQTAALAAQLQSMPDGGVFVLTVPPAAYRCPPGPYERACQVAWYLKTQKPRAKLIVLDANPNVVSKTALFRKAWEAYPNLEYRGSNRVIAVDPSVREVRTDFDRIKYDVINLIPPQRAGAVAVLSDLIGADKRWCEVDHLTYESVKRPYVHVIGDATTGLPVPKSGNVANAMGKICALAITALLRDRPVPELAPGNTCYSFVSDREAIAVVNAYRIDQGKVVQIEQKLTPVQSELVARRAQGWAEGIWHDMLG